MRRAPLVVCAVAAALGTAPARAGKIDDLAACMWRTMPASTEQYRTAQGMAEVVAFMRASSQCEAKGNVNIKALKKAVAASRPGEIGQDTAAPTVFVQPKVQK